ncbi:hypothetical protein [Paeniglutamicibacter sulfureus]|uniref:hypothetical protein n=1 Tax=Paeniglutamicibacter sulfureus TaxID=43666 RepID=UPI00286D135D|nr:hypothetical protein [Paeniglutamicibacter sulfureus]
MGRIVRCRFQAGERHLGGHDVIKWMVEFCVDLAAFPHPEEMVKGFIEQSANLVGRSQVVALRVSDLIQCGRQQFSPGSNLAFNVSQAVFDTILLRGKFVELFPDLTCRQSPVGGKVYDS